MWFVLLTEAVSFDSGICLQLIFDSLRMFLLHKEKVEIVVLNCAQPLTQCLLRMINDCIRLSRAEANPAKSSENLKRHLRFRLPKPFHFRVPLTEEGLTRL